MKMNGTIRSKLKLSAILVGLGCCTNSAQAALTLTITEYTTDAITLVIDGDFDADTIGERPGYLAIKNDWENNEGQHTEWFSGTPTVDIDDLYVQTARSSGFSPYAYLFSGSLVSWGDSYVWLNSLTTLPFERLGTTPFVRISGTLRLTGDGLFAPDFDPTSLDLVSGFNGEFTAGSGSDWARHEADAVLDLVPEPSAVALLLGLGALGCVGGSRRR